MFIIKEYKLIKNKNNHPVLKECENFQYNINIFKTYDEIVGIMENMYNLSESFVEYMYVLSFSSSSKLLGIFKAGQGGTTGIKISIKEIFISLLLSGCEQFVLIHNHPNGILEPSDNDILFHNGIKNISNLLGINFLDSIIISNNKYILLENNQRSDV